MIEINLLPKELRKKRKKIGLPKIQFAPVVIGVVFFLISLQLILSLTLMVKKNYSLRRMEAKWTVMGPKEKAMENADRQVMVLGNKIKNIEALLLSRILWAKKLNELSDSMIPGIWLTNLSLNETGGRRFLSLKGSASSFGRDEAAIIGRFMKILKDNKVFFQDFSEIELVTIQQKKMKNIDVMSFSICCYFKKEK